MRRIKESAKAKHLPAALFFIDFSKAFDTIHQQKMKEILLTYNILVETVNTNIMSYTNTKSMVILSDTDDRSFFEITVLFKAIH